MSAPKFLISPEGVPESAPLVCNVQVLAITKLEG